MQEKNKHNLKDDLFSRSVREKLDDFRLPVEEADWVALHNQMKREKRKQSVYWLFRASGVIAAVGLLLFYFASVPPVPLVEDLPIFSEEILVVPEVAEDVVPEIFIATDRKFTKKSGRKAVVPIFENQEEDARQSDEEDIIPILPFITDSDEEVEKKKSVVNGPMPDTPPELTAVLSGKVIDYPIRKKRWKISTGLAGGSGINNDGFRNSYDSNYYVTDPGPGGDYEPLPDEDEKAVFTKAGHREIQDLLDERNYSETYYSLPISFSFTVKGRITKKVSIESGLVYTYFSSRMEQYGSERITTRIKQHYIGIPLNIVVDVWENGQWHWYISGGGMIEKGVRLAVNEDIVSTRSEYIERRSGMNGVQGSLHVASGIEYALSHQWSLYVEPRFSYYFDNDQPVSVRTDRPLVVSFGGGLRYSF